MSAAGNGGGAGAGNSMGWDAQEHDYLQRLLIQFGGGMDGPNGPYSDDPLLSGDMFHDLPDLTGVDPAVLEGGGAGPSNPNFTAQQHPPQIQHNETFPEILPATNNTQPNNANVTTASGRKRKVTEAFKLDEDVSSLGPPPHSQVGENEISPHSNILPLAPAAFFPPRFLSLDDLSIPYYACSRYTQYPLF